MCVHTRTKFSLIFVYSARGTAVDVYCIGALAPNLNLISVDSAVVGNMGTDATVLTSIVVDFNGAMVASLPK